MSEIEIRSLNGHKLMDEVARQKIEQLETNGSFNEQVEPLKYLVSDRNGETKWEDRLAYEYNEVHTFCDVLAPVAFYDEAADMLFSLVENYQSSYMPPFDTQATITIGDNTFVIPTAGGSDSITEYWWYSEDNTIRINAYNTRGSTDIWQINIYIFNASSIVDVTAETLRIAVHIVEPLIKTIDEQFLPQEVNSNLRNGEGDASLEGGDYAHRPSVAKGVQSLALGGSAALGTASYALGYQTAAYSAYSLSEGSFTITDGPQSHAEGDGGSNMSASFKIVIPSEPTKIITLQSGESALGLEKNDLYLINGDKSTCARVVSYTDNTITFDQEIQPTSTYLYIYKPNTRAHSAHSEGSQTIAASTATHSEGYRTRASKLYSHAEGESTIAESKASHTEGRYTSAFGWGSHAEGYSTIARGAYSHSQGQCVVADGASSTAEGEGTYSSIYLSGPANTTTYTVVDSSWSTKIIKGAIVRLFSDITKIYYCVTAKIVDFNEVDQTITLDNTLSPDIALTSQSVRLFYTNIAHGDNSHSEGTGSITTAKAQHVEGEYNLYNEQEIDTAIERGQYVHIVGNGTAYNNRSNAHTLDWDGNAWYSGDVYVGSTSGTNKDEGSKKLATEEYVNNTITSTEIIPFRVIYQYELFFARKGMTWREWCDSIYNNDEWYCDVDGISSADDYIAIGTEKVLPDDVIIPEYRYDLIRGGIQPA